MAEEGKGSTTILVVVVIGLVLFLLLNKATAAAKAVNASVKQTYTPSTAVSAVATSLAPALGQFLSGSSKLGGASSGPLDQSGIPIADGGGGSWDTTWQNTLPAKSAAFADDTSNDYLLD